MESAEFVNGKDETKRDYQDQLRDEIAQCCERSIVAQAQLTYALNSGDWLRASDYLDEMGGLHKTLARKFRKAALRRSVETAPLQKVLIAVINSQDDFSDDRLLDKVAVLPPDGYMVLFVKRGLVVPRAFGQRYKDIFYFDDTEHFNGLLSAFVSTHQWKIDDRSYVQIVGHGAREMRRKFEGEACQEQT